jgi:hypothetical protein
MKSIVPIIAVTILIFGHAGAATNSTALVQIESKDFGDTNSVIKIVEFERNTKTSKLRMTHQKLGSSVGSSMFVMLGFYEVAKARGAEYFINLKEWNDKDGSRIYVAGFTNIKDADLKKEFGDEYGFENEYGQKRVFMSVSELKLLFERQKSGVEPGGPANRSQPIHSETNRTPRAAGPGR